MRRVRRIHALLSVFFAPAIILFAFTGIIQTLDLQARENDPPKWMLHVVEVHKHQKWQPRQRAPQPPAAVPAAGASAPPAAAPAPEPPRMRPGTYALKAFVVLMGLGLTTSATLGLVMAWQVPRDRKLVLALVAAGSVLPAAFLTF